MSAETLQADVLVVIERGDRLTPQPDLCLSLRSLPAAELQALYEYLLHNAPRFRSEWEDDFLEAAGGEAVVRINDLAFDDPERWHDELKEVIVSGHLPAVREFLDRIGVFASVFNPLETYDEVFRASVTEDGDLPFEIYPIETRYDDGCLPEDVAASLGFGDIASFLKEARGELHRRYWVAYREGKQASTT